jgi:hypothetical protein
MSSRAQFSVDDLDAELLNEFYSCPKLFTVTATLHEAQLTSQPTNSASYG